MGVMILFLFFLWGVGEEKEGLFFFQSGCLSTFKYLILVVGALRDTWIYLKFCILGLGSCLRFRV
jgi:hypothetical protein